MVFIKGFVLVLNKGGIQKIKQYSGRNRIFGKENSALV